MYRIQILSHIQLFYNRIVGFPCDSAGKESTCNAGDLCSIPGLGRYPGGVKGYPFQYSGLDNSMNCIVHGITKSRTQLSNLHSLYHSHTHSCEMISHCGCDVKIFPDDQQRASFHVCADHLYVFFEKCLLQYFAHLKTQVIFLLLSCESLIYLGYEPLIMVYNP